MKNKSLLLVADIGNSNITIGFFSTKRIVKRVNIPTKSSIQLLIRSIKKDAKNTELAVVTSVVPKASVRLKKAFRALNIGSKFIGKDIHVPIANLYKDPKQVGKDRLVNGYAAKILYGYPAIIIDFGTATTFDYIDKNGAYSGGIITPGVELTIRTLSENTALLPKIDIKKPKKLIGKTTTESIRSGIVNGIAAMCGGLISEIKSLKKSDPIVIATGGLATLFKPCTTQIDIVDRDLTLKGLLAIYMNLK